MKSRSRSLSGNLILVDGLFALVMALAAVVYGNSSRVPFASMNHFLETRITILNAAFAAFFMAAWTYYFRSLDRPQSNNMFGKLIRAARGCLVMSFVLALYLYASHTTGPTLRIAAAFFVASVAYKTGQIVFAEWIAARDPELVIILGSGPRACKAWRELRTRYHSTVKLLGFVDDRALTDMAPDVADRYLGSLDDLSALLLRNVVDELLIALPMKSCYDQAQRAIAIAEQVGVHVANMGGVYSSTLSQSAHREQEFFSELAPFHEHYVARQTIKRVFDIVGSLTGLFLLAPLLALIAIAVKLTSPGPVLFVQERYGYRRRLFHMYKFRSMVKNAPELLAHLEGKNEAVGPIFKMKQDPRMTRLGRVLRAWSLDELPQLFNVLLGHMSLVGPRPMSVRDVSLFSEALVMRRFTVKPGITGLLQVNGRSAVGFDQWIKSDFSYIDDWSLALDFQILARTVTAVVKRTGAV